MDKIESVAKEIGVDCKMASASSLSTFKGGGRARVFRVESVIETCALASVLQREKIDFSIIANGSNTLVSDGTCKSALIDVRSLCAIKVEKTVSWLNAARGEQSQPRCKKRKLFRA